MSIYWPLNTLKDPKGTPVQAAKMLKHLSSRGVILIAGSGNGGLKTITGIPAGLAVNNPPHLSLGSLTYVPDMLVVGAVNAIGELYSGTNLYPEYNLPHIYAPGLGVRTAWVSPPYDGKVSYYKSGVGTSLGESFHSRYIGLHNYTHTHTLR